MTPPGTGPRNGRAFQPVRSVSPAATCGGSRAGMETWWIMGRPPRRAISTFTGRRRKRSGASVRLASGDLGRLADLQRLGLGLVGEPGLDGADHALRQIFQ